ncbi:MAG: type I restriction enzyme HsdR N-terminal domain-containing protein [Alphaproteobacteria bacterium]|nr:type I restriction enzyme HsdR N-terminal domain-containing protein [Alphaproteobacteria bacterium]
MTFKPNFNINNNTKPAKIFDIVRKKWVVLTPEETVRQYYIHQLVYVLKYPPSLISVEKKIKCNQKLLRYDIVVYKERKPWILIECKSPEMSLNENVLSQVFNYNYFLKSSYLGIVNGKEAHYFQFNAQGNLIKLNELPNFS